MSDVDELLRKARSALARPFERAGDAAAAAVPLFLLADVEGLRDDPRVSSLVGRYREELESSGHADVLAHQLRYATRLAEAPGELGFEELFKLFSLLEEIHALRALGLAADADENARAERAVRARYRKQRKLAATAADGAAAWLPRFWLQADTA